MLTSTYFFTKKSLKNYKRIIQMLQLVQQYETQIPKNENAQKVRGKYEGHIYI